MKIKEHIFLDIKGFVQGVGFRPFIFHLAEKHQQLGWVENTNQGVSISIEGAAILQQDFLHDLKNLLPTFAEIHSLSVSSKPLENFNSFLIKQSVKHEKNSIFALPDISPCPECIADLLNPKSRFYCYPFTSCCHCGPRYSIILKQPYDRVQTSMKSFSACPECLSDYSSSKNRRFHSQTIACKYCGPQLSFIDKTGTMLEKGGLALTRSIEYLKQGKIVAIKGVGGFQLLVDASNAQAVEQLRLRKSRPEKPFALLIKNIESAKLLCEISKLEQQSLVSYASPIVLMKCLNNDLIVEGVAPNNKLLGLMLPASPLHHLIANDFNQPLIVTSANISGDPICITEQQALSRLSNIADFFLSHDREIVRPLDDSIIRVINNKATVLRRARGYSSIPLTVSQSLDDQIATGGQMKNTVAISHHNQIILSQHIGELDSLNSQNQFQQSLTDLQEFYSLNPRSVSHDLHPDYHSTVFAKQMGLKTIPIQHHHAHILACMAEHDLQSSVLGFAWDGTGLGLDNTIWGGECLTGNTKGFQRYAYFKPFVLVGGDKVASEPRRAVLGLLYGIYGDDLFTTEFSHLLSAFSEQELKLLRQSLKAQINTPYTSSVGRLFDGVSSLIGLCQLNSFEGQAAMLLEQQASDHCDDNYSYKLVENKLIIIDWQPMIMEILADISQQRKSIIAAKFQNTLAEIMLDIANKAQQQHIVLSGGCFQNAYLTECCVKKLEDAGYTVFTHEKIPPNDGGIALGQLYASTFKS